MCFNGAHSAVFRAYLDDLGLLYAQILLILEREFHYLLIFSPRRPAHAASEQQAPLPRLSIRYCGAGLVGCLAISPPRASSARTMPFARAAYGGLQGILPTLSRFMAKHIVSSPSRCGGKRGFISRDLRR